MISTSIPLTWTSAGSEAVSYEVEWTYDGQCAGISGGRASAGVGMTSYTIDDLEEAITYSITVNATNAVGDAVSPAANGMTSEAGKTSQYIMISRVTCYSLQFPLVLLLQSVLLVHPLPSLSSGSQWTVSIVMES